MFSTLDETRRFCSENGIRMADFMMVDLDGRWRHLTMPIERLTAHTLEYGVGFDGSNYGFAPVEKSDMVFVPDLSTAWKDGGEAPTLAMIGDIYVIERPKNRRFGQDPRSVAAEAERYLISTGIADEFRISPEFEFHVFRQAGWSVEPHDAGFFVDTPQAQWNSGSRGENNGYKVSHKGGYHAAPPLDVLADFRSRASLAMEAQGIAVKYHHHEVGGPGQVEIEVEFGGLREMADKTMLTKYILKNMAVAEGKTVTFMPKPLYDEVGNGLHVHMHLFKGGQPLFYDENGYSQLSKTALAFIGGILQHAGAVCAFTNPSTNSYKRLVPGYEAPVTVGYATANRSSVIRIPSYAKKPEDKRFELRCPDATCNPYYAFSAILMAGLDGVKKGLDPAALGYGPYDFNLYNLSDEEKKRIKALPRSLPSALDALEADHDFLTEGGVFPPQLIEIWLKNKRAQAGYVGQMPTPAEYQLYYDL